MNSSGSISGYILRRILIGLVTLWFISIISFTIIQLPPGDFVSSYIAQLIQAGGSGSSEVAERLRADYGLDDPMYVRYWKWFTNLLRGDFGTSLQWNRPVDGLIGEYLGVTLVLILGALLLSWAIAFPIGVYSAMNRNTLGDYVVSTIGMMGLAVPNFLVALGALYVFFQFFNIDLGTVQSAQYVGARWSIGQALDLLVRLFVPMLVLATPFVARLVRVLRANLLDEIARPYVTTARAKGLRELNLVLKYPTRISLNPFVSSIGMMIPTLVSGSVIVSLALNIPSLGTLLLSSLQSQDMFLASGILMILAVLTVVGTLISDLLLAWLDPRITLHD